MLVQRHVSIFSDRMDALRTPGERRSRTYSPGEDQLLFARFYECYQALAGWIHHTAILLALDRQQDQEYKQWRKDEDEFEDYLELQDPKVRISRKEYLTIILVSNEGRYV